MANTFNNLLNPKIKMNEYNNIRYVAYFSYDGDMYPKSVKGLIRDNSPEVAAKLLLKAEDSKGLLNKFLSSKYRKLPNGNIYVNPWIETEKKNFWLKHKPTAILLSSKINETELYWLLKDMCKLDENQFTQVLYIVEDCFKQSDIQYNLFIGGDYPPILKNTGDVITKDSVFESDKFGLKTRIEKIFKEFPILVDNRDNPANWDWYVPEVRDPQKIHQDHLNGLDLEPEMVLNEELELKRLLKDLKSGYNQTNIGWALARSANSWRCGGPQVEEFYSECFYDFINGEEGELPGDPRGFFESIDRKWGNEYYHISPDQQAMWQALHDLLQFATEEEINEQFNTFIFWFIDTKLCEEKISSYKADPMYGPKARLYNKVDGEISCEADIVSYETLVCAELADENYEECDEPQFFTSSEYEDCLDF